MPPEDILAENTALRGKVRELETDLKVAEMKIQDLQRRLHGRKSERRAEEEAKDQAELGIEVPEAVTLNEPKEEPAKAVTRPRRPRHPLPERLERIETKLEPERWRSPKLTHLCSPRLTHRMR